MLPASAAIGDASPMLTPIPETYFDERLTVAVPADFRDAVRMAADRRGLTLADYAREALAERMDRDGVSRPDIPTLSRRIVSGPICTSFGYSSAGQYASVVAKAQEG